MHAVHSCDMQVSSTLHRAPTSACELQKCVTENPLVSSRKVLQLLLIMTSLLIPLHATVHHANAPGVATGACLLTASDWLIALQLASGRMQFALLAAELASSSCGVSNQHGIVRS